MRRTDDLKKRFLKRAVRMWRGHLGAENACWAGEDLEKPGATADHRASRRAVQVRSKADLAKADTSVVTRPDEGPSHVLHRRARPAPIGEARQ